MGRKSTKEAPEDLFFEANDNKTHNPKSLRDKAQKILEQIKRERKGKYKIVQIDEKTWKEVKI